MEVTDQKILEQREQVLNLLHEGWVKNAEKICALWEENRYTWKEDYCLMTINIISDPKARIQCIMAFRRFIGRYLTVCQIEKRDSIKAKQLDYYFEALERDEFTQALQREKHCLVL